MKPKTCMVLLVGVIAGCCSTGPLSARRTDASLVLSPGELQAIDETAHPADTTLGIITLGPGFSTDDTVRLYNQDGSLWHLFSYKYDDSDGKYDFYNSKFQPLSFHPDYYRLALTVTSIRGNTYEVIVNESNGLKKFIEAKGSKLKFETTQQFILRQETILFDIENNPVRNSIDGKPLIISDANDRIARPKKLKGDWLMITYENSASSNPTTAWIRWRKSQRIIISFPAD